MKVKHFVLAHHVIKLGFVQQQLFYRKADGEAEAHTIRRVRIDILFRDRS